MEKNKVELKIKQRERKEQKEENEKYPVYHKASKSKK
jgi:hypothetical protein